MPVKQFSLYPDNFHFSEGDKEFTIEAGNLHLAFIVKQAGLNTIEAFDLYRFSKEEAVDYESLIQYIKNDSKIFQQNFTASVLYINNEKSVLVPSYKFNKEVSEDYLRIAFGDDQSFVKSYDVVNTEPLIMNAYRTKESWLNSLTSIFQVQNVKHSYTSIIENASDNAASDEAMFVQFYNDYIIVCAVQHGKLLIIQSLAYETPDDILYFLLHLSHQLNLTGSDLAMNVSGMIDLQSNLYTELVKYFDNVQIAKADQLEFLPGKTTDPIHYFIPFCNLAL